MKSKHTRKQTIKSGTLFTLTEDDFKEFLKPVMIITPGTEPTRLKHLETITEKRAPSVEDINRLLPKALAKKLEIPEGFELSEITITGEISGKPFGVGVSGQVSVTFTKPKSAAER